MKKNILVLAALSFLISCNSNTSKGTDNKNDSVAIEQELANNKEVVVSDLSNAKNSLDYAGTYKGVLPTASGEGMSVVVTLDSVNYTKEVMYIGEKMKPIKTKGTYKWDSNGTVITLEGEDVPNQYFVGENTLTQLDIEGNKITGELANMYVLKK